MGLEDREERERSGEWRKEGGWQKFNFRLPILAPFLPPSTACLSIAFGALFQQDSRTIVATMRF